MGEGMCACKVSNCQIRVARLLELTDRGAGPGGRPSLKTARDPYPATCTHHSFKIKAEARGDGSTNFYLPQCRGMAAVNFEIDPV